MPDTQRIQTAREDLAHVRGADAVAGWRPWRIVGAIPAPRKSYFVIVADTIGGADPFDGSNTAASTNVRAIQAHSPRVMSTIDDSALRCNSGRDM